MKRSKKELIHDLGALMVVIGAIAAAVGVLTITRAGDLWMLFGVLSMSLGTVICY